MVLVVNNPTAADGSAGIALSDRAATRSL